MQERTGTLEAVVVPLPSCLFSTTVRKGKRGKKPGPAVHDDHLRRDFTASAPNLKWVTDITEHPTAEGKASPP